MHKDFNIQLFENKLITFQNATKENVGEGNQLVYHLQVICTDLSPMATKNTPVIKSDSLFYTSVASFVRYSFPLSVSGSSPITAVKNLHKSPLSFTTSKLLNTFQTPTASCTGRCFCTRSSHVHPTSLLRLSLSNRS